MVGPLKMGAQATSDSLELLKDMFDNRVVPVDRHSAVAIARARVEHPDLRLPDAAVVAAADIVGADAILTTDDDFDGVDAAVRLDRFLS